MTVAGGLRYEAGREMPPGMQELYGVKLAGDIAKAAEGTKEILRCAQDDSVAGETERMPYCGEGPKTEKLRAFDWPHESSIDKIRRLYMNGEFEEGPKMEPIITVFQAGWKRELLGEVLKAVGEIGVYVNEERLVRALREAESFWEEGYLAGVGSDRGWISVDKYYPDSKTKVMVFGGAEEMWVEGKLQTVSTQYTGYTRGPDEGWFRWDDHMYIPNVTHWRPMLNDPEVTKP